MRVAKETRVGRGKAPIHPHGGLIAEKWARSDAAEAGEIRTQDRRIDDAPLFVALPVAEKEDAVPADRAAQCEAELTPLEEGVRVRGIAIERWISGQLVIAEEIERGAMEIVPARARDHVDRSGVREARRQI